jgi:hypothetical protein
LPSAHRHRVRSCRAAVPGPPGGIIADFCRACDAVQQLRRLS